MAPSLGDATNGGLGSGGAKYKTAIPVDQLQVRTMVGDAHECHGIWEMIHCGSECDARPEKIYQFASSQEARRDFIRTIHFSIRENIQQPRPIIYNHTCNRIVQDTRPTRTIRAPNGQNQQHYLKSAVENQLYQKHVINQHLCQQSKPNLKQPIQRRHDGRDVLTVSETSTPITNYAVEPKINEHHQHYDTSTITTVHSHRNHPTLQSGTARLVQTSNDRYSSQTLQHQPREAHRSGSPVWKPRTNTRLTNQSPATADAPTTSETEAPQKQRVAFLIPHKCKEFEDTDC